MIIFDLATYAMEALAVGFVDPYDANSALDQQHLSWRLGTMRRDLESTFDEFPWNERSFGTTVESIAT
ncbi:MAG: hypothetical protein ABSH00_15285 [Bryobacteraceae bacterium]|jgi:hypothetical protein